jgi:pSer/pThr/pTyr-binding forkhead associated (FHA) protein/NADPH-dependent 2,4-dienoyl-CoA reductase/sulfur reductase-like enzyme
MRHIIIGDGATGTTAAHYIRAADKDASITIVSDDPNPAYYRAALTNYLLGELQESQLFAVPPDFYIVNGIDRILARVNAVDAKKNKVTLADGREIEYDRLLIASGSRPNTPNFPGAELSGVMTMRTLQDVRTVLDGIRSGKVKRAVVVGGGPLGIEWVQGLMRYKIHVTYLLRGDMFFDRALDRTGSDLVISRLRSEGVDVRLNEEIATAVGDWNGKLKAIRLKNANQTIDCQLAGTAIGIRPNLEFLQDSGIEIAKDEKRGTLLGVIVDKHMRTNIPNVYAGGDVIHRTLGLWEPARLQGRIAGRNMTGGSETFDPGEHYFATRLYDLDFASVGSINEKPGDQVLVDFPRGSGRIAYRKVVIREGKLVGALMLGQRKENVRRNGLFFKKLIERKTDVSSVAERMLDPEFDLPGWIDSLNMSSQVIAVRSMIATSALPPPASVRKSEMTGTGNTFAVKPLKAPQAVLKMNGSTHSINDVLTIGRNAENNVVIKEPLVSSRHARIEKRGVAYFVVDNKSTNGTFVNENRIKEPLALKDGDVIEIGHTTLRFTVEAEAHKTSVLPEEIPLETPPPQERVTPGAIEYDGKRIELKHDTITLGRDPEATIRIDDPTVSFMHAQIAHHGEHHYLRDLGSRNGTFVNDTLVVTPCVLNDSDIIRIGKVKLTFHSGMTSPAPAPKHAKTEFLQSVKVEKSWGQLIAYSGSTIGLSFALKPPSVTLGRDPESNVITLQHQTISREHARFDWRDDKWFVTDLQSANGTRINGTQLVPNKESPIAPADELQFGDVKLVFVPSAASAGKTTGLPMTFVIEPEEEAQVQPPVKVEEKKEERIEAAQIIEKPKPPVQESAPEISAKPQTPVQDSAPKESAKPQAPVRDSAPSGGGGDATNFIQTSFPTRLTVLAGPAVGRAILLVNLPLTVGRASADNVQGLDDPLVSRRHLRIVLNPDGTIGISDIGSVNGSFHNGIKLEVNQAVVLNKGDELRLGSTVLKAE